MRCGRPGRAFRRWLSVSTDRVGGYEKAEMARLEREVMVLRKELDILMESAALRAKQTNAPAELGEAAADGSS